STPELVIFLVRRHFGRARESVAHIEKPRDGGDVPDVALGKFMRAPRLAVFLAACPGLDRELPRKIQHRARAGIELRRAVIRDDGFGERRIAGEFPHRGAMRDEAIVAMIGGGNRDGDQFTLQFRQARWREHQIVRHRDKGFQLRKIEFVGLQNVRDEAEFFLAFREIGLHGRIELYRRKIERNHFFFIVSHGYPRFCRNGLRAPASAYQREKTAGTAISTTRLSGARLDDVSAPSRFLREAMLRGRMDDIAATNEDQRARHALIAETARISEKSNRVPAGFVAALFSRVSHEDIVAYTAEDIAALAEAGFEFLQSRSMAGPKIRLFNPLRPAKGALSHVTDIEMLNDDMPFLLDSVMGEIGAHNLEVRLVAHPILSITRDQDGKLKSWKADSKREEKRESFIHIHVERIDESQFKAISNALDSLLAELRIAVNDWQKMLDRV